MNKNLSSDADTRLIRGTVTDVFYLQAKYSKYSKFKRKQIKKEKRKLQLLKKYEQKNCEK